tara:strand:- start:26 stop:445 length:420 start_codon:yes stop_codon:yes gene_type:complete
MNLKFHHINLVSKNLVELNDFYQNILGLKSLPQDNFKRTESSKNGGYSGAIKFVSDGNMQMHLAEKDLSVAAKNKHFLNPVEKGHIAFRTDNINYVKKILQKNNINFSDYGNTFSKEWHQIFFQDPEGNIVEIHQEISK